MQLKSETIASFKSVHILSYFSLQSCNFKSQSANFLLEIVSIWQSVFGTLFMVLFCTGGRKAPQPSVFLWIIEWWEERARESMENIAECGCGSVSTKHVWKGSSFFSLYNITEHSLSVIDLPLNLQPSVSFIHLPVLHWNIQFDLYWRVNVLSNTDQQREWGQREAAW